MTAIKHLMSVVVKQIGMNGALKLGWAQSGIEPRSLDCRKGLPFY